MTLAEEFNQQRGLLFSIAYHMLGTVMDAEDMIQETYVRLERARAKGTPIQSVKDFCARIITNLCLDYSKSAAAQRETYIGPWLPEPIVQPQGDSIERQESLSIAFLALLEKLSATERAVLIMRKVFDYEYADIARMLDKSEAACRQLMSRAQKHLDDEKIRFEADHAEQERLTLQFIQTIRDGDVDGLVAMMTDDAIQYSDGGGKAYAALNPIYGPDKVARFWLGLLRLETPSMQIRMHLINGEVGFVIYDGKKPMSVIVPHIVDGKIHRIYSVLNPDKLRHVPDLP